MLVHCGCRSTCRVGSWAPNQGSGGKCIPHAQPWKGTVEQARGIFYTTQDTLLLTLWERGEFAGGGRKREVDDHIGMMCIGIYT